MQIHNLPYLSQDEMKVRGSWAGKVSRNGRGKCLIFMKTNKSALFARKVSAMIRTVAFLLVILILTGCALAESPVKCIQEVHCQNSGVGKSFMDLFEHIRSLLFDADTATLHDKNRTAVSTVPIPEYLKEYATLKKTASDRIVFSIKCPCGNESFIVLKNDSAGEETKGEIDRHSISVLKAVCSECNQEIVLFDSRQYGYDGLNTAYKNEETDYTLDFKQTGVEPYRIDFIIENDSTLEEFREATGTDATMEMYSNSFSWICIYGTDMHGKRTKLFEQETA